MFTSPLMFSRFTIISGAFLAPGLKSLVIMLERLVDIILVNRNVFFKKVLYLVYKLKY